MLRGRNRLSSTCNKGSNVRKTFYAWDKNDKRVTGLESDDPDTLWDSKAFGDERYSINLAPGPERAIMNTVEVQHAGNSLLEPFARDRESRSTAATLSHFSSE